MFPGANLSGERCCLGFKASVVAEQGVIRFLQDVPLEEVSNTLLYILVCFLRGPPEKSNQHLPPLQARSTTGEWESTMSLYLRVADLGFYRERRR